MKIQILKNFKKIKRVANVEANILRIYLESVGDSVGPVVLENSNRVLGCVNLHYRIKCKSSNCFLIQKEIGATNVGHNRCHKCHLEFLKLYQQDKINIK